MDTNDRLKLTEVKMVPGMWLVLEEPYLHGNGRFHVVQVISVNDTHITLKKYAPCTKKGLVITGLAVRKIESIRKGEKHLYLPNASENSHIERFQRKVR